MDGGVIVDSQGLRETSFRKTSVANNEFRSQPSILEPPYDFYSFNPSSLSRRSYKSWVGLTLSTAFMLLTTASAVYIL